MLRFVIMSRLWTSTDRRLRIYPEHNSAADMKLPPQLTADPLPATNN